MAPSAASPSDSSSTTQSPEEVAYFTHNPPPTNLSDTSSKAQAFISHHTSSQPRRVALVTSGGTTVPLENQTVRFIDNFSAGTRGACSAEYLLSAAYAVIFLHRQYSLLPFARHYSHSTNCFLDFMDFAEPDKSSTAKAFALGDEDETLDEPEADVVVRAEWQSSMRAVLSRYKWAQRNNLLLLLPYVTINEYLWSLRTVASLMKPLGSHALFYLAAAVSDFFVPAERMVEHKIQSGEEFRSGDKLRKDGTTQLPAAHLESSSLIIDLDPVPKFLKRLVDGWAPEGMIVSFKLETDPAILINKARGALQKYAHHLVIGNLLSTRKWEVVFVYAADISDGGGKQGEGIQEKWIRVPCHKRQRSTSGLPQLVGSAQTSDTAESTSFSGPDDTQGEPIVEIESLIIPGVKQLHDGFITRKGKAAAPLK